MGFPTLAIWNRYWSWPCVCSRHCSFQSFRVVLFLALGSLLIHVCVYVCVYPILRCILNWVLNGDCLQTPRVLSLCSTLPYSGLQTLAAQGNCQAHLGFPLPVLHARNFLQAVKLGQWLAHLISFPPLRDHGPLFSYILCLVNLCFICIVWCFHCFGHESKSRPCYSISANSTSAHPLSKSRSPHNSIKFLLVKTSHMAPLGYNRGGEI